MGDAKAGRVRLSFNPQLRVEFRGATVTSDAGLLLPASWTSASTDTRSADPGVESSGDGGVTCQSFMEENMRALIVHTKTNKARAARARRASPRRCAFRWCN